MAPPTAWRELPVEHAAAHRHISSDNEQAAPERCDGIVVARSVGYGQTGDGDRASLRDKHAVGACAGDGERTRSRPGEGQARANDGNKAPESVMVSRPHFAGQVDGIPRSKPGSWPSAAYQRPWCRRCSSRCKWSRSHSPHPPACIQPRQSSTAELSNASAKLHSEPAPAWEKTSGKTLQF